MYSIHLVEISNSIASWLIALAIQLIFLLCMETQSYLYLLPIIKS